MNKEYMERLKLKTGGMLVQKRISDSDKRFNHSSPYQDLITSPSHVNFGGVKNGSKSIISEDECIINNEEMERASRDISAVAFEVDNLAKQVVTIEMEIKRGYKVLDKDLLNLTELLMIQLIKLDGIVAHGDVKMQRRVQVKRVQKYIEILDLFKIRNYEMEKM